MPRERTIESRVAEHEKFRRQCEVRIKSGLKLCIVGFVLSVLLLWQTGSWVAAAVVAAFPLLMTGLEVWGFRKHDRALRLLSAAAQVEGRAE